MKTFQRLPLMLALMFSVAVLILASACAEEQSQQGNGSTSAGGSEETSIEESPVENSTVEETTPGTGSTVGSGTGSTSGDTVSVQILGINDFEGNLEVTEDDDGNEVGGAAYLASALDRQEQENPDGTIRVHVGDLVGASPLISSYFHDG